jgi:acyl carrier protein
MDALEALFYDFCGYYSEDLKIGDIEAWDSLSHFTLVLMLEDVFKVKFQSSEFEELLSVKAIREKLCSKNVTF